VTLPPLTERFQHAFQHILFSIEDGVALLSLNRPEQLNSFNSAMHLEVREALKQVRQSNTPGCCC
jgi:2-(1,2-epoxy-1,2-dihydrophenyl)acetyl-CoA isomerase